MKKIEVCYWISKFPDLPWADRSLHEYSKELRSQIIDECVEKGYSVMVRPMTKAKGADHDGELIWIDNKRFQQR